MGYDVKGVSDSSQSSHSYSKTRLDEIAGRRAFEDKILIDQVFEVVYDRDDAGKIKPKTKRIVTYVLADNVGISPKKVLKGYKCLDELFHVYYLEEDQFDPYNPPWMSDVVPLQRSLNEASENTDTILHGFAKTRWKQRQGDSDNISVLQNRHMQLIRYDGAAPEPIDMPNPPEALFRMMQMRSQQIEDQVGQHGASMGIKEGTQSGRHAALIQAGDQDNMKEPADGLQKALSWAFERVLDFGSENLDKVTKLYAPEGDGMEKYAIGESYAEKLDEEDRKKNPVRLRAFKNIRVTVVPGSFFTLAQAKTDYLEMLPVAQNLGLKSEGKALWKVMTRVMNVGLSRSLSRLVEHEEKQIQLQNADWEIAQLEFLKMSDGDEVTATPEQDHEVHLRVKVPGLEALAQKYGQDNDAYWIILKNIQQHDQMMQMKQGKAPEATDAMKQAEMESMQGQGGGPNLPPGGVMQAASKAAAG